MKPWHWWALGALAVGGIAVWNREAIMATLHFPWREIDPTGKGQKSAATKANLEAIAWKLETFRSMLGGIPLKVTPHGGFEPKDGFPDGYSRDSATTQHKAGKALDVYTPDGMSLADFHAAAKAFHKTYGGGLGLYDWGIHLDNGPTRGPWGSKKPDNVA